jgi:uncharacterized membrane protein YkoI
MLKVCLPVVLLAPTLSFAEASLQDCLHAVTSIRPGKFHKVEYLSVTDEHQSAYEIEVKPVGGRSWEFECGTQGAVILEMQQQVDSPADSLFKAGMKLDQQQAIAIATRVYPGEVEEIQYELDVHGAPRYELDIVDADSIRLKVEVSAVTGKIEEVQVELWQIGADSRPR